MIYLACGACGGIVEQFLAPLLLGLSLAVGYIATLGPIQYIKNCFSKETPDGSDETPQ